MKLNYLSFEFLGFKYLKRGDLQKLTKGIDTVFVKAGCRFRLKILGFEFTNKDA